MAEDKNLDNGFWKGLGKFILDRSFQVAFFQAVFLDVVKEENKQKQVYKKRL
jgi:hypothetical protein